MDDELLLRAPVALAGLPRHHQLGLAIERRVRADQLDQRRKIVEFTAVAHLPSFLYPPLPKRLFLLFDLTH